MAFNNGRNRNGQLLNNNDDAADGDDNNKKPQDNSPKQSSIPILIQTQDSQTNYKVC